MVLLKETDSEEAFREASRRLQSGEIVLIFDRDDREKEVDMVVLAEKCTPETIFLLRRDAGGLICVCVHPTIAEGLKLPFLTDIFEYAWKDYPLLKKLQGHDIPYGERSSFSLTINHRKTFTGVTDRDRSLTIREFASLSHSLVSNGISENEAQRRFGEFFRSPGHVFLLRGAENLLYSRKGHTELSLALAEHSGLTPVTVICEIMDGKTGNALSLEEATKYAKEHNLLMIDGETIIEAYCSSEN